MDLYVMMGGFRLWPAAVFISWEKRKSSLSPTSSGLILSENTIRISDLKCLSAKC